MKSIGILVIAMLVVGLIVTPFALANHDETRQPEDLSGDGFVDRTDLRILLKNWGDCKYALGFADERKCVGDLNQDHTVNVADLLELLEAWNPRPSSDLNGDGIVGPEDLNILLDAWGKCTSNCIADLDGNHIVNVQDLLILLRDWTHEDENSPQPMPNSLTEPDRFGNGFGALRGNDVLHKPELTANKKNFINRLASTANQA